MGTFVCVWISAEIILFPFGDENGDSRLQNSAAQYSQTDIVSETIKPDYGFPLGYKYFFSSLYVSMILFNSVIFHEQCLQIPESHGENMFTIKIVTIHRCIDHHNVMLTVNLHPISGNAS